MKKNIFDNQEWEQINKFSAHKAAVVKPAFTGVHAFLIAYSITFYVLCLMKAYGVLY